MLAGSYASLILLTNERVNKCKNLLNQKYKMLLLKVNIISNYLKCAPIHTKAVVKRITQSQWVRIVTVKIYSKQ